MSIHWSSAQCAYAGLRTELELYHSHMNNRDARDHPQRVHMSIQHGSREATIQVHHTEMTLQTALLMAVLSRCQAATSRCPSLCRKELGDSWPRAHNETTLSRFQCRMVLRDTPDRGPLYGDCTCAHAASLLCCSRTYGCALLIQPPFMHASVASFSTSASLKRSHSQQSVRGSQIHLYVDWLPS